MTTDTQLKIYYDKDIDTSKLLGKKVLAETAIPIALMGFVIPKLLFAWTAKTKKELESITIEY